MTQPPQKPEVPNVLFQYRPPEPWAFGNLSRQVIYFGSPRDFNDPYDCDMPPRIDDLTDEQHDVISRNFSQFMLRTKGIRLRTNHPKEAVLNYVRAHAPSRWRETRNSFGIACFSERYNDPLMWSHYGGRGEGFCLAFDAQDERLFARADLQRVYYSAKRPYGGAAMLFEDRARLNFLSHKSEDWKYEREWRLFRSMANKVPDDREEKYAAKTLKAVYFGTEATEDTQYRVFAILRKIYPHAKIQTGYRSQRRYKIRFKPFYPPRRGE